MKKSNILLVSIILLAVFFRFQNINWDSGFHLHPDERFLTMVGNAMKLPSTFYEYFDSHTSPFNPVNVGFNFFVYGIFPLVLNKLIAIFLLTDSYNLFTLQGRILSGLVDIGVVFFVFKTVFLIEKKSRPALIPPGLKYWAAFLYASAVLPIQLSHFFAADTFLNFFMFGSFYFALRFFYENNYRDAVLSGVMAGLGIAAKVNAVFIIPLLIFFLLAPAVRKKHIGDALTVVAVFFLVIYLVVRVADPYYFENPDIFDPTPNRAFVANIQMLKSFEGKDVLYPPSLQWINTKPFLFSIFNLGLFGIGAVQFLFLVLGFITVMFKRRSRGLQLILVWVGGMFIYQSVQFAKVLRYFIFLYPFFAIIAAFGLQRIIAVFRKNKKNAHPALYGIIVGLCLVWPLAFTTIYFSDHTRIQASRWINEHVSTNSLILGEYWDDPLPLYQVPQKQFQIEQLTVFDPESKAKWEKINGQLKRADYYVLSSNRGWGSIPTVSKRFPKTTQFYQDLFAGKLEYKLVKSFYPSYYPCNIFHTECPRYLSDWFDESFTVYDHPTVYIFRKEK